MHEAEDFPLCLSGMPLQTIWYCSVSTAIPNEQKYRCSSNSRGWLSMSLLPESATRCSYLTWPFPV